MRARIAQVLPFLRMEAFDTRTEMGRSKERYRRAMLSAIASIVAKGISIIANLIIIPISLHYLGNERYGLWMTITSFTLMLTFADLGLGNGLMNAISDANGRDDSEAARCYVSSALFMLMGIAVLLTVFFWVADPYVPWQRVFNVSSPRAVAEAGASTIAFFVCFAADIPLGIPHKVHMGYQEGFIFSSWAMLGSLMGLAGVLLAIHEKASLPWLVLSVSGAPVIGKLMNGFFLFGVYRPELRPALSAAQMETAKKLLSVGVLFFVLQVTGALALASDGIVAAQVLGPGAVTQYSIPMKLFSFGPLLVTFVTLPLWPAYCEAIARGDMGWVRKTLRRSMILTVAVVTPISMALIVLGKQIIRIWVGPSVHPSMLLLVGLGVWAMIGSAGGTLSMFWNGANVVLFQVIFASLIGVGALVAKIFLARWIGVPGIIWGDVAAYCLFAPLPTIIYLPKVLSRLDKTTVANGAAGFVPPSSTTA